ncbi:sarcocystatin-A-like [Drosophila busckii]|uniref:sarcocystatin-A-like n=1 Tax=Drosophila busckii TaxID=30019 RepID=UPI00083ED83B|nr:sarcocystatin-A-like [Drosophila busckii]
MLSMKVIFLLGLTVAVAMAGHVPTLGGVEELSGAGLKEAEDTLNLSLTKLAAGEGPNYKLGKIISASRQTVSGFKYIYQVELVEGSKTKTCNVEIWSRTWLKDGIEVTFNCPEGSVTKKHSV